MSDVVRRCPFCGGKPTFQFRGDQTRLVHNCATMDGLRIESDWFRNFGQIVRAWNSREE